MMVASGKKIKFHGTNFEKMLGMRQEAEIKTSVT